MSPRLHLSALTGLILSCSPAWITVGNGARLNTFWLDCCDKGERCSSEVSAMEYSRAYACQNVASAYEEGGVPKKEYEYTMKTCEHQGRECAVAFKYLETSAGWERHQLVQTFMQHCENGDIRSGAGTDDTGDFCFQLGFALRDTDPELSARAFVKACRDYYSTVACRRAQDTEEGRREITPEVFREARENEKDYNERKLRQEAAYSQERLDAFREQRAADAVEREQAAQAWDQAMQSVQQTLSSQPSYPPAMGTSSSGFISTPLPAAATSSPPPPPPTATADPCPCGPGRCIFSVSGPICISPDPPDPQPRPSEPASSKCPSGRICAGSNVR